VEVLQEEAGQEAEELVVGERFRLMREPAVDERAAERRDLKRRALELLAIDKAQKLAELCKRAASERSHGVSPQGGNGHADVRIKQGKQGSVAHACESDGSAVGLCCASQIQTQHKPGPPAGLVRTRSYTFKCGVHRIERRLGAPNSRLVVVVEGSCPYLQSRMAPDRLTDVGCGGAQPRLVHTAESRQRKADLQAADTLPVRETAESRFVTAAGSAPSDASAMRAARKAELEAKKLELMDKLGKLLEAKVLEKSNSNHGAPEGSPQPFRAEAPLVSLKDRQAARGAAAGHRRGPECDDDATDLRFVRQIHALRRPESSQPESAHKRPNEVWLPRTGSFHSDMHCMQRQVDAKSEYVIKLERGGRAGRNVRGGPLATGTRDHGDLLQRTRHARGLLESMSLSRHNAVGV
jgi:hypothetical protein